MKVFSTSLCFGLLALLSVMNLLKSVHGQSHLISEHELFPAKEHTIHEKLLQALLSHSLRFQRPSHAGVDLRSKPEGLRKLKKLKEGFMKAKNAELFHAVDAVDANLSSSRTNKRACFWKYCV